MHMNSSVGLRISARTSTQLMQTIRMKTVQQLLTLTKTARNSSLRVTLLMFPCSEWFPVNIRLLSVIRLTAAQREHSRFPATIGATRSQFPNQLRTTILQTASDITSKAGTVLQQLTVQLLFLLQITVKVNLLSTQSTSTVRLKTV